MATENGEALEREGLNDLGPSIEGDLSIFVEVTKFDDFPDFCALSPTFTPDGVADGEVDSQYVDFSTYNEEGLLRRFVGNGDINATGASVEQLEVKNLHYLTDGTVSVVDSDITVDQEFDGTIDKRLHTDDHFDHNGNIDFSSDFTIPKGTDQKLTFALLDYEVNEHGDPIKVVTTDGDITETAEYSYEYDQEGRIISRERTTFDDVDRPNGSEEEPNGTEQTSNELETFEYNEDGEITYYSSNSDGAFVDASFADGVWVDNHVVPGTAEPWQAGEKLEADKLIYDVSGNYIKQLLTKSGLDISLLETKPIFEINVTEDGIVERQSIDLNNDGVYEFDYQRVPISEEEFASLNLPEDYNLFLDLQF